MDIGDEVLSILSQLRDIPMANISLSSRFADYNMDSLAVMGVMFAIEEHFHIEIPDEMMYELKDVQGLVDQVRSLVEKNAN